jgi:hypothetical protein
VGYEELMDSPNRGRRVKQRSLPKPASPQNLLYGRHIESELGIDVMTILEPLWGKRDNLKILMALRSGNAAAVYCFSFLRNTPTKSGSFPVDSSCID